MSTLDTDTITRRRDATLNTYWHDGTPESRALAWLLATVGGGRWITEDRIWRHITFRRLITREDVEVIRVEDWRPIENEHGWSTTELILVRITAQLADTGMPPLQVASVGDLHALDDGNWRTVRGALEIGRDCRGPNCGAAAAIEEAFDRVIERSQAVSA